MNKRFLWNFEINSEHPLTFPNHKNIDASPHQWESRYFWPIDKIITLNGLTDDFLKLSHYKIKERNDTYYILPNSEGNFKRRRQELFYKPMLLKKGNLFGYGKKISLKNKPIIDELPGYDEKDIEKNAIKLQVEKDVVIYQFETTPPCKLELARLSVANQHFYSVGIESSAYLLVESISRQLLKTEATCDYISFLRGLIK